MNNLNSTINYNTKIMKKTLFTGILAAVLLGGSMLTAQAQTLDVDRTKYPDYTDKVNPDWSLMAPVHEAKAAGMKRVAATQRPDHVNNAETRYFPPVFNQDGGSCGSASRICYMFSHELAAYRDLDGSKPENYYPSHFVWLHTNSNHSIIGQGKDAFVMYVGVPSAATYGGQTYSSLFGYQEETNNDFGWMQGYDKWFEAMHNRMLQPSNFPVSVKTEEGREAVKNWLWNHNGDNSFHAGGICGIGVASGGVWRDIPKTETNDKIGVTGMGYVYEWGVSVDHALTIVGYDDRIEFDLDKDGIIGETNPDDVRDKDTGERVYTADVGEVGAWIIVNSWGGWENDGFIYCPYAHGGPMFQNDGTPGNRTMLDNYWTPEIYKVRKDYRPLRTIKLEIDYSRRSELALSAGISADLNATAPENTVPFVHFTYAGDGSNGDDGPSPEVPMLGRWADGKLHDEPMEFGYDLTDLTAGYDMNKPLKYFFIIDTQSWAEGKGTIHNASIIDYRYDEQGIETPFGVGEGVEIKNAGNRTIISVVVQGSSYYAPQNVVYTDGTLTWQTPMRSAATVNNYRVYADGMLVAELPANTTTYTPEATTNASEYAVTAIYANGNESSETTAITPVTLSSPNTGIEFANSGFTIPGVFASKYEQATIEYWIKPTTVIDWNQSGGPGWGTFMFHANATGQLTVGWSTQDRMNTTDAYTNTLLKPGEWIHVAMVINKNKITVYLNGINRGSFTSQFYRGVGGFGDLVFSSDGERNAQNAVYDEIRIWNVARTKEQIKASKDCEFTGSTMPQGLIAYLKGDTFTDEEGNLRMRDCAGGHHAKLHGSSYKSVTDGLKTLGTLDEDPTVSINLPEETIYAGIPVTLTATYNDAVNQMAWTAEGAGISNLTVASPTLTFATAGTHSVSVTATSASGKLVTATRSIYVEAAPAPEATFTMTATGTIPAGERVTLHATAPRMGYMYEWSMPGADDPTATSPSTATSWQQQGTYKVTLTVTAPDGSKKSHAETIEVVEVAPEAAFSIAPAVVLKGEPFTLNDESLYTPLYRRWHITNGTDNYIVYADTNKVAIDKPGIYNVTLTVSNNSGQSSTTRERAIIVTNADSKNGLVFGYDAATVTTTQVPFTADQKAFTIDWWMNPGWPADETNGIGDNEETLLIKTMSGGKMQLYIRGKNVTTADGYIVPGEWHHYAVTFASSTARFYRDGVIISTRPLSGVTTLPEISTFRIGGTGLPFKGNMDELRVWGSTLSEAKLRTYANAPIEDIAKAEADDKLVLYYNFNQSGGDVQDATSNANHGTRTGFGPDGDAWGLSRGVFSLSTDGEASGEDITAKHLKNYTKPFNCTKTCVNPSLPTRTFALTGWTLENTITEYGITAGAHVDKGKESCFTVTTGWDTFASKLTDHKAFQTITLPAGCYTFAAEYGSYEGQCGSSYLVVAEGNTLPATGDLADEALAYTAMKPKGSATNNTNAVTFVLAEESTISLGLLANMSGSICLTLQRFSLTQEPMTVFGTTEEIFTEITYVTDDTATAAAPKGIYDLTGRQLRQDSCSTEGLAPGIYIIDGRKTIVK